MRVISVHEKCLLERFLRKNVYLHLYSLGDLDDFFWPYTMWFGFGNGTELDAVALLYTGSAVPTVLALSEETERIRELLESVEPRLPSRFYAHLSPGLESSFDGAYEVEAHGPHYKMGLRGTAGTRPLDCAGVYRLGREDLDDMLSLYEESYPGNCFDPRMLDTNQYFGFRGGPRLVSVAGIHVYSPECRVASLGNIATLPSCRGRGYATKVTAAVCQSLEKDVEHIGLNVKADNQPAISCYRGLGFEIMASYGEFMLIRK